MDMIVAVTQNWGIGKDGNLLVSIPDDMKFFREKTAGAVVLMGRATLESLPGKKPLKGRDNIVLTRDTQYEVPSATVVHNAEEALEEVKKYAGRNIFVIGGESIYRLLLPYCENAFVTKMEVCPEADKFFPDLDAQENWEVAEEGEKREHNGIEYRFMTYRNREVKM